MSLETEIKVILKQMIRIAQRREIHLYSIHDFEELTGYSPQTQQKLRKSGEIGFCQRYQRIWYRPEHILDWLDRLEVDPKRRPNN